MRSNYKQLGQYIRQVDVRNTDGVEDNLLGVSVQKVFIPSIANTIGTDFSKYKIVKRRQFTYIPDTSRRGDKIGIALLSDYDEGLVSNIYTVFEVINENELLPEYLMLWFSRPEFDRYARFKSHGSVREIMDWEEMCKVELPVPPIEEQRRIVRAYQIIKERIELKQKINDNLVSTIKALFKSWFIDFSSISEAELVSSIYGKVPTGWRYVLLGDLCDVTKGTTPTTLGMDFTNDGINFIKGESINDDHSFNKDLFAHISVDTDEMLKRSRILENDIVFTIAGTLGKFALVDSSVVPANTNQAVAIIRPRKIAAELLYSYFLGDWQVEFYKKNIQQAVQANLSLATIKELPILLADEASQKVYQDRVFPLISIIKKNQMEIICLNALKTTLLSCLLSSR